MGLLLMEGPGGLLFTCWGGESSITCQWHKCLILMQAELSHGGLLITHSNRLWIGYSSIILLFGHAIKNNYSSYFQKNPTVCFHNKGSTSNGEDTKNRIKEASDFFDSLALFPALQCVTGVCTESRNPLKISSSCTKLSALLLLNEQLVQFAEN